MKAEQSAQVSNRKKRGCIFLAVLLIILWFVLGWFLWQWALMAPVPDNEEPSKPFELIPKADD